MKVSSIQLIDSGQLWLAPFKRQLTGLLGLVLMVSWASLLTIQTLDIQHSCTPLLQWTEVSTQNCPAPTPNIDSGTDRPDSDSHPGAVSGNNSKNNDDQSTKSANRTDPSKASEGNTNQGTSRSSSGPDFKEVAAIATGSVAVAGLAIVGAPLAIAAGIGFTVWFAARTLLKS